MKNVMSLSDPPNYEILSDATSDQVDELVKIRVNNGPLAGLVFCYNTLKFGDAFENGDVPLHFSYNVIINPSEEAFNQDKDRELVDDTLASILFDVVKNSVKNDKVDK